MKKYNIFVGFWGTGMRRLMWFEAIGRGGGFTNFHDPSRFVTSCHYLSRKFTAKKPNSRKFTAKKHGEKS